MKVVLGFMASSILDNLTPPSGQPGGQNEHWSLVMDAKGVYTPNFIRLSTLLHTLCIKGLRFGDQTFLIEALRLNTLQCKCFNPN